MRAASRSGKRGGKWLVALVVLVGWAWAWFAVWDVPLLERLYAKSGPGVTVFTDRGDYWGLWVGTGLSLFLGGVGVLLLAIGAIFRANVYGDPDLRKWALLWRSAGLLFVVVGVASPILFPSAGTFVIDERKEVVGLERRWLYATRFEGSDFDDLVEVNLRVFRTRDWERGGACAVASGLSLVHRGGRINVTAGFGHEQVGREVAEITGARLREVGRIEC